MKNKEKFYSIALSSIALVLFFLIPILSTASAASVQNSSVIEPYAYQNSSVMGPYAYITSSDTDTVSVIDIATQWQKSLGGSNDDETYSIQQTSDGGYIVAGYSDSNDGDVTGNQGDYDYWVVKLDTNGTSGNIVWQKSLGGSSSDQANSIQQTFDGGYIVAGLSVSDDSDVTGNHGYGYYDYWVVKLDTSGNILWQKCLGGSSGDEAYSIQQTSDGGYIVAGSSYSNDGNVTGNHGYGDYWIVKLDTNGNIVWQKSLGGSSYDEAHSIQQTSDGGYIVAGYSYSNDGDVTGNHGYDDYWIVKLDTGGDILWQKSLGGSNADEAFSIQQTSDGDYIVAGYSYSNDGDVTGNHGYYDYWIVKLDTSGNIVWQKSLGGSGWDYAHSIQQTSDGGYIVAGTSDSNDGNVTENHGFWDYWVVKLDTVGNIMWQKSLGGSGFDDARWIQQTSDSGYIIAGRSESIDGNVTENHGSYDYWVVKLAAQTQIQIPVADFSATPTFGNMPLNVSFIDQSTGSPTSWLWDFGDGNTSNEQNPTHTYSAARNYTVNLTVSNADGTASKSAQITVSEKPAPVLPVANFSSNVTTGNAPLSVQFTDLSENATEWNWSFGSGATSNEQNPTHTYSAAGNYTVTLTANNSAGSNTVTKYNYISVAKSEDAIIKGYAPLSVQFTDLSADATEWNWSFGDGNTSTEQNPKHTYSKAGQYTVTLAVSNVAGSDAVTKYSYVSVAHSLEAPSNTFSAYPTAGKVPLNVSFTDNSTGTPISWNWSFGDGTTSTEQNPTHTYSKAGQYSVTLTTTNAAGSSTVTRYSYISVVNSVKAPVADFSSSVTS